MKQTSETVVKVGAEGGSLTLTRARSREGEWQFFVTTDEGTLLDLLSDEDRGNFGDGLSELGPVATWEEALILLDRHPWVELYPLVVHEEFQTAVWAAVVERGNGPKTFAGAWPISTDRWRRLCFPQEEGQGTC